MSGAVGRNLAEDFHASRWLRIDEAVAGAGLFVVGADDLVAGVGDRAAERLFHFLLGRPADSVGGEPQVAAGDEVDFVSAAMQRACGHGSLSFVCEELGEFEVFVIRARRRPCVRR